MTLWFRTTKKKSMPITVYGDAGGDCKIFVPDSNGRTFTLAPHSFVISDRVSLADAWSASISVSGINLDYSPLDAFTYAYKRVNNERVAWKVPADLRTASLRRRRRSDAVRASSTRTTNCLNW